MSGCGEGGLPNPKSGTGVAMASPKGCSSQSLNVGLVVRCVNSLWHGSGEPWPGALARR